MIEKYELFIEANFESYTHMHESRPHSNLWGKQLNYGDEALVSDHIGYYSKNVLLHAAPKSGSFHEEYPH